MHRVHLMLRMSIVYLIGLTFLAPRTTAGDTEAARWYELEHDKTYQVSEDATVLATIECTRDTRACLRGKVAFEQGKVPGNVVALASVYRKTVTNYKNADPRRLAQKKRRTWIEGADQGSISMPVLAKCQFRVEAEVMEVAESANEGSRIRSQLLVAGQKANPLQKSNQVPFAVTVFVLTRGECVEQAPASQTE